jgi:replication factor A1
MFIKDLQPRQTNVDVEGEVLEMSDVREFNKMGRQGKVANALIKDGTGRVKLSLWNEQIEKVKVGDKVKVTKGYVGEFQGELQLTTGKFGALEIVKGDSPAPEQPKNEPAPQPKGTKEAPQEYDDLSELDDEEYDESDKDAADELDVEEEDFS